MGQEAEPLNPAGNWLKGRSPHWTLSIADSAPREGLKDQPIADVGLLLSSKEMQFRDAAKGRKDLGEEQKAANRQLELEIKDLSAYMKGQLAGLSLSDLRSFRQADRPGQHDQQRQFKPRDRGNGMERSGVHR